MTSILKTALEDIKKLDESLDPEDWASDESMLSITGRVIAALKEAIKNEKTCAELLSEQGYEYSRQTNALIKRHAEQMEAIKNQGGMCAKGQAFKDYVHQRLDAMGVPHSVPESEHDKAGCRIGGRLDYVEAKLKSQGEPVAWLSPNGLQASTSRMLNGTPLCHCTSVPAGEPVAWRNGERYGQQLEPIGEPSFSAKEGTWHDIPLYAGYNPTSAPTIPAGMVLVRDGNSLTMLQSPDGRIFRIQQLGTGDPWGNAADNDELVAMLSAVPKGDKP